MDISKIHSFIAVANTGSFTKAAEMLYLSQSTVSKHISGLEKELDIKLFYRNGMSYSLTAEGKKILRYYSELIDIYNRSNAAIEEMKNKTDQSRQLSIVGGNNLSHYGIICSITSFMKDNPDIQLNIDDANPKNMQYSLLSGDFELGFCLDSLLDEKNYSWQFYFRDELSAFICNDSPYREKEAFYAHELEEKPLIAGTISKDVLQKRAEKINRKLNIAIETVDPSIAIELLLINPEYIFIAPKTVLDRYPGELTHQVPLRGLGDCSWVFAWKRKNQLSQLTREYLAYMREYPPQMFIEEALNRKIASGKYRKI